MISARHLLKLGLLCSIVTTLGLPSLSALEDQEEPAVQSVEERGIPEFSVAGFLPAKTPERQVHDFNVGWRFKKGEVDGGEKLDCDDDTWEIVNVPHGLELAREEMSGCSNYQGPAWYRKHVDIPADLKGGRLLIYFEGIMGKSELYVNGKLVKEHLGGYLPLIADIAPFLQFGKENIIAVRADNSDDPAYPPGKPQTALDFNYSGGIYRDVYLIKTGKIHITDPNQVDEVAGGGVFFYTKSADAKKKEAVVGAKIHLANGTEAPAQVKVQVDLKDRFSGEIIPGFEETVDIPAGQSLSVADEWTLNSPRLWSPETPNLYDLVVSVKDAKDAKDEPLDGMTLRVGIRSFTMTENEGLVINGEPYTGKLIGGNRHQDFAVLGNAVANVAQWRDAKKLRDAGFRVVRSAHYPQDPAFMDAADELGLFVIVATPGWQFWNKEGNFEKLVYGNIRDMIRRDRNHPSVWVWEPILNETHYPADFAKRAYETTHEEYPYPGCYAASDSHATDSALYDLIYAHPPGGSSDFWVVKDDQRVKGKAYFTREFGDNVDTWSAHNSPSRASRRWGELPMIIQAAHYIAPDYAYASHAGLICKAPTWLIGGTLWHPFDHQRGYHPDPFYGGIYDAFRQPKMSRDAFKAQHFDRLDRKNPEGASVFIAHEITPFSPEDITVYSNCEEVRLTPLGGEPVTKKVPTDKGVPAPPLVFEKSYNFQQFRANLGKQRDNDDSLALIAEGLINGKVVATDKVYASMRPEKIELTLDNEGIPLRANGSDFAVAVATLTDGAGRPKRLNNEFIRFEIEGPAVLVGDDENGSNPKQIEWGTAPIIVRTTNTPGKVTLKAHVVAEGGQKPQSALLEFETVKPRRPSLHNETPESQTPSDKGTLDKGPSASNTSAETKFKRENEQLRKELNLLKNKEVELQQKDFDGTTKKN